MSESCFPFDEELYLHLRKSDALISRDDFITLSSDTIQQAAWEMYSRDAIETLGAKALNFSDIKLELLPAGLLLYFPNLSELSPFIKLSIREKNKQLCSDETESTVHRYLQILHRLDYLSRMSKDGWPE
jgi:hypothetical protein